MGMNVEKIREDFPILSKKIAGKRIIYLDSSCMALKPKQVVNAMNTYYNEFAACGGRSMHSFANTVTEKMEESRKTMRKFINAKHSEEIIFTKNTTEGINLIANTLPKKNDIVVTSDKEHNSNLIPWLKQKNLGLLKHKTFRFSDVEDFSDKVKGARLASFVHVSNLDGTSNPAREMVKIAHENDCLVLIDAAQSAPHLPLDIKKLDADFISFSGHKMLGPTGTGILYGKKHLLEELPQFIVGGETVKESFIDRYEAEPIPHKFEAGLQDYAGIMGIAEAAKYIEKAGRENIHKHEQKLNKILTDSLKDEVNILGSDDHTKRAGIFSFNMEKINHHDVALMLNESANIMIRSGAHCVHSWFNKNNMDGSARASVYMYNTEEEVNTFIKELRKVISVLK